MITPVELLGKDLKRGIGYKTLEVDEFLDEVARDFETLYNENHELKEKVSAMEDTLTHYRNMEDSLKRSLLLAEKTSKESIENAQRKAKAIEDEGRRMADAMVEEAKKESEVIKTSAHEEAKELEAKRMDDINILELKIKQLKNEHKLYKKKMIQLLHAQESLLESPIFDTENNGNNGMEENEN